MPHPSRPARGLPTAQPEPVAVSIYLSGPVDDVVAFLEDNGGDPRNMGEDYIEAYVPVDLLGELSEQAGVLRVREIIPPMAQLTLAPRAEIPPEYRSQACLS